MLVDRGVEALEERLADGLLHQDASSCQTDLPAIVVLARRLCGGGVEVGVLEDYKGPLAAELGRKGYEILRCGDPDQTPRLGRAGEGDAPQQRMRDERGARLLP